MIVWLSRKFPSRYNRDAPWKDRLANAHDDTLRQRVLQFPLFVRLQDVTGIRFTRECSQRCFNDPVAFFNSPLPFIDADLLTYIISNKPSSSLSPPP
jgi:hypothetical protein